MATWSGIRKKLETEYLAQSLQGHIQYYATTYSRSHDHEGRAAIRYDQRCFYNAFAEFDNQDIETSLKSENLIVKIFAVLDRRVGKRRLKIMKETIMEEPDTFREFYAIRVKAEGML